jgi:drug/metabolite transporter (DMT)-like permease
MALGGIARIGQIQLLQPFVALAASAVLLGEAVGWLEIGFAVLVVGIVALGWQMRVRRQY